jgi:hypothetical protein
MSDPQRSQRTAASSSVAGWAVKADTIGVILVEGTGFGASGTGRL